MIDQKTTFGHALNDHLEAIASRNIERFSRTLHRDVRLVGPTGSIIHGYDDAVAAHRGWFAEEGWSFEPTTLWLDQRADAAWALTSVRYIAGGALNRFLLFLLFVSTADGWKLMYDQNTPLTDPNP